MLVSDVTLVLLTDVILFLNDVNQKLNFYSQDNKVSYLLVTLALNSYLARDRVPTIADLRSACLSLSCLSVCLSVSLSVCLPVCLSVCLLAYLDNHMSSLHLYMLPVSVTQSCSDDSVIFYAIPVLWMTSCFCIMSKNQKRPTCMFSPIRQMAALHCHSIQCFTSSPLINNRRWGRSTSVQ